ncbi:Uncharacterised protein [Vibrio cholerae]|nr:Uncharacterised protein [Vibrio cholerae]
MVRKIQSLVRKYTTQPLSLVSHSRTRSWVYVTQWRTKSVLSSTYHTVWRTLC